MLPRPLLLLALAGCSTPALDTADPASGAPGPAGAPDVAPLAAGDEPLSFRFEELDPAQAEIVREVFADHRAALESIDTDFVDAREALRLAQGDLLADLAAVMPAEDLARFAVRGVVEPRPLAETSEYQRLSPAQQALIEGAIAEHIEDVAAITDPDELHDAVLALDERLASLDPDQRRAALAEAARRISKLGPDVLPSIEELQDVPRDEGSGIPIDEDPSEHAHEGAEGEPPPPYVAEGSKWGRTDLTWCLGSYTPDIGWASQVFALNDAMAQWSGASKLHVIYNHGCTAADIRADFNSGWHWDIRWWFDSQGFDGANGTLAHAFFPSWWGFTHFDDGETWTTSVRYDSGQPIDLASVAVHEFGHALGLNHSADGGAVMEAYYNGSHRDLAADDLAGIRAIYGMPTDNCLDAHLHGYWGYVDAAWARYYANLDYSAGYGSYAYWAAYYSSLAESNGYQAYINAQAADTTSRSYAYWAAYYADLGSYYAQYGGIYASYYYGAGNSAAVFSEDVGANYHLTASDVASDACYAGL